MSSPALKSPENTPCDLNPQLRELYEGSRNGTALCKSLTVLISKYRDKVITRCRFDPTPFCERYWKGDSTGSFRTGGDEGTAFVLSKHMGQRGSSPTPCWDSHQGQPPGRHLTPHEDHGTSGRAGRCRILAIWKRNVVPRGEDDPFPPKETGLFPHQSVSTRNQAGWRQPRVTGESHGKVGSSCIARAGVVADDSDSAGVPRAPPIDVICHPWVFQSLSDDQLGRALEVTMA